MTPDERIAEIRERWQDIWDGDGRYSSAGDVQFLLTYIPTLRAVAEAAEKVPHPTCWEDDVQACAVCDVPFLSDGTPYCQDGCKHAQLQSALQRWKEVTW